MIVGIESSGIHSNGFSLVRRLVDGGFLAPDADLLLEPTRLYPADMAALKAAGVEVHAAAHITGGGLPENLPRIFPDGLRPSVRRGSWPVNQATAAIIDTGRVPEDDLWATFNMGLGLCVVLAPDHAARACAAITGAHVVGEVSAGQSGLVLTH